MQRRIPFFKISYQGQTFTEFFFNPYLPRKQAIVTEGPKQSTWLSNARNHWSKNHSFNSAKLDWKGRDVYSIGHGSTLKNEIKLLDKIPENSIRIFLNSFPLEIQPRDNDYFMTIDENSTAIPTWSSTPFEKLHLITFPGISESIYSFPWKTHYAFTHWPKCPTFDKIRQLFPDLVQLYSCLSVTIPASHLTAVNDAKRLILVSQDFTFPEDYPHDKTYRIQTQEGSIAWTTQAYHRMSCALTVFCGLLKEKTGLQTINTSKKTILGFVPQTNHRAQWITHKSLEELLNV